MQIEGQLVEYGFEHFELQRWPPERGEAQAVQRLIAAGVVLEGQLAKTVYCPDCEVFHRVQREDRHGYSVSCASGARNIEPCELRRWQVETAGLLSFLVDKLALDRPADQRVPGGLWYLGLYGSGGSRFPIWLLRYSAVCAQIGPVNRSLESRSPNQAGVVLVSHSAAADLIWPRGSKALRLGDLFQVEHGEVSLDLPMLLTAAPEDKRPKGRPGRPAKSKIDPRALFRKRVKDGLASRDGVGVEAKAIRNLEIDEVGEDHARSRGTVLNIISKDYRLYKASVFSRDTWFPHY